MQVLRKHLRHHPFAMKTFEKLHLFLKALLRDSQNVTDLDIFFENSNDRLRMCCTFEGYKFPSGKKKMYQP